MSKFFIDHPVFAWVIAIVIMLAGILSIRQLPIEQYPDIAPPSVTISAAYPGASAEIVDNSVTQLIEQQLTGIDYLRYIESQSDSSGSSKITVTFDPAANPDMAQVQVQNKVQRAISLIPSVVQALGINVTKSNGSFLLVAGFYSQDGKTTQEEMGDRLTAKFQDVIARVNGVGDVRIFGEPRAMRIWLNPHKLLSYSLTAMDVRNAVQSQNIDVSAGQLGSLPAVPGQELNATVRVQSRLSRVQDFEKIILRENSDGSRIRLRDVARIELGSEQYQMLSRYKRKPAVGMAVSLASGANALDTAEKVKGEIEKLKQFLPAGVKVVYPYDTTPFIKLSINQVVETLFEAVMLVIMVMLLFLQNVRATFIPAIAVPVVLLGTFGILYIFGFTINVLTMFAMVLAIGLLVDDAIVVVENVERVIHEEKLAPKEATRKSMTQITAALIGIALVLSSVFIPMAFFGGSAGAIYRQFSVTIVSAMILSVLVALILSPTLCASVLSAKTESHEVTWRFLILFNNAFQHSRDKYLACMRFMILHGRLFLGIYLVLLAMLVVLFIRIPTAFIPNEDQGMMFLMVTAPSGSTVARTLKTVKKIEDYFLEKEIANIENLFTVTGFSFAGVGQNVALGFIGLKDWDQRKGQDQSVFALTGRAMGMLSQLKDAMAFAFYPPPIRELGNASGFNMQLIDRNGLGHEALTEARNKLLQLAAENPKLVGVRANGLDDVPQFKIDIDTEHASVLGLAIPDVYQTLQLALGSAYVNDFVDQGRIKKVYMQADQEFRMLPSDIGEWTVKNRYQKMVSFDSFCTFRWIYGSPKLERFNGNASINIQGSPAPGISTGEAMQEMAKLVQQLPAGFGYEWSGLSYEEKMTGQQTPALYALSILVIFLSLAALYESWSIPFSILFILPLGVIGVGLIATVKGLNNDIYLQVALLTTLGLTAKNAILIVEFAKKLYMDGYDLVEATLIAAKQRYRPIIMTSIAFILGVTPLALAKGAGSAAQNAIGIGVIGGMLAATTVAILFVPLFYVTIQRLVDGKR